MAKELEKFWLVDKKKIDFADMVARSSKILEIEQAALPADPRKIALRENILKIESLEFELSDEETRDINESILKGQNNFPNDLELRYRTIQSHSGKGMQKLITMKGNQRRNGAGGLERNETEFEIDADMINRLRKLGKDYLMIKTRVIIPDGNGHIQVNFYTIPTVSFVMVEREFKTDAEVAVYRLPDYLARLNPASVPGGPCFGDKILASEPNLAETQYAEFKRRRFSR